MLINEINQWIDETNHRYFKNRKCCIQFKEVFQGYYTEEFLCNAYFVVCEKLPKPDFQSIRDIGLGDFLDLDARGITYKNTYYLLPEASDLLQVHFHELVHVAQWKTLGASAFIERYITEILTNGYHNAPLEEMAYGLDSMFSAGKNTGDVKQHVETALKA